jgi:hypothetical protein
MVGPSRPGERPYDIDNEFQYQDAWNAHPYPACTSHLQPEGRPLTHGRTFPSSVVETALHPHTAAHPYPAQRMGWNGLAHLALPCLA